MLAFTTVQDDIIHLVLHAGLPLTHGHPENVLLYATALQFRVDGCYKCGAGSQQVNMMVGLHILTSNPLHGSNPNAVTSRLNN